MKIHILGASASGVTTIGKQLAKRLQVPYFDSDNYFWIDSATPFTIRRNPTLRNEMILNDITNVKSWVLGGSVIHWGENLFPKFDLIIFLYVPKDIRIERLKKREFERYGDIIHTDKKRSEQFNNFIAWAEDYDNNTGLANRTLEAHEVWLAQSNSLIFRIAGDYTAEEITKMIADKLKTIL